MKGRVMTYAVHESGSMHLDAQGAGDGRYQTRYGVVLIDVLRCRDGAISLWLFFVHEERVWAYGRTLKAALSKRGYLRVARAFAYDVVAGRVEAA